MVRFSRVTSQCTHPKPRYVEALLSLQGFRKAELLAAFRRFDVRQEGGADRCRRAETPL